MKDAKLKKQFEALREESNALPRIDYERVNNAKRDYLRAIFEQEGQQVLRSEAFKTFFHVTDSTGRMAPATVLFRGRTS